MALDGNERKALYRNLINDPATQTETKKYSFTDWERKLLGDEKAIGKLAQFSVGRNWAIDENDFVERYAPELKAPPTKKATTIPPVGIAAPVAEPAPSMTDMARQMAFQPPVQEPVEPVEPIGVMAPPATQEPIPSITETAREMAFKPPVQPQKTPEQEWDEMSFLDKTGQTATEAISGFNRALLKTPSSIVKTASELGVGVLNMLGGNMESEDAVLYSLADKYDKWLDTSETARKFVGSPEYTGLAANVGSGLGQVVSMIAAGPQGASKALLSTPGVLKAVSQKMFSKPSLIAFSQVFNSEFENMKAKGESEQTAFNQGLANALATSPLENLPLINLAERLNKTIGVKLARRVLNAIQQGVEEGGQEAVQQIFSNLTNNQLVESEENIVDWAQGIQPSAEAGGVVGLLIGGLANAKAARKYSKKPAAAPGVESIPAEEVQDAGYRTAYAKTREEIPVEYRNNVAEIERATTPLGRFGPMEKVFAYRVPTETIDITPQVPTEVTPEPAVTEEAVYDIERIRQIEAMLAYDAQSMQETGMGTLVPEVRIELQNELASLKEAAPVIEESIVEEEATVSPLTEEELALIEETELTPEEEAALLAEEEAAPVAPVQVLRPELPEIQVPKPEGFAPSLRKLGYTDEEISKMTLEQQQEIAINKTEPARAEGSSKVDVAKENQRVEKVAEAQRKIDEEIAAEEAAPEAPIATTTDSKGRVSRFFKKEETKSDGTKVTTFQFERSDKGGERFTAVTGVPVNEVIGDQWQINENDIPPGAKPTKIVELREANDGRVAATVVFENEEGLTSQGEVTLTPKPKPVAPAAPAPKGRKKKEAPVTLTPAAPKKEGKKAESKKEKKETSFKGIASFETAKGSVYTVLPNGKTQRFKTATKEQNEPQDLTVFVKFKDAAQEQDFLEGVQRSETSGTKVYVIDKQGNKYDTNEQAAGKDVRLALVKDGKVIDTAETSTTPQIGYNTFDQRRLEKDGEGYRQVHIGNKVVKINEQTKAEAKGETRIEQSKSRAKDSKDAQNHSADLSGEAYELEDGTGLVQGFNLMGKPVYSGYKKGKRTRLDIDSYTGDVFTAEELSALKELKKELEASEKAAQTQDPFKQQGRVAKTDSVPDNVRKLVEDITKSLGIDKKIIIITDGDFNEGQYQKHGLYGTLAQVRSAKQSASNPYEYGAKRYMSDADAFYIYYDGKLKGDQLFTVISHELGHIVEQEVFNNSSEQTKKSVKEDYEKWLASLTGKTVEEVAKETRDITLADLIEGNTRKFDASKDKYISSFSEYFADNVAKWARTSAKPKSAVDKYFSGIVEAFKKLHDYVFEKGLYSKSLFDWLDGMYEAEPTTTPEFTSSQSSEAATAFDKAKTSKGFDKKHGKGAYKALSDITKNFDDIMDNLSDKIKQDCL